MRRARWMALSVALSAAAGWAAVRWLARSPAASADAPPAAPLSEPPPPSLVRREVAERAPSPAVERLAPREDSGLAEQNNAALAALEAGELERAVALLEACVAAEPSQEVFRRNLAEALARLAVHEHHNQRPCAGCTARLQRALELAPGRVDLRTLLERWQREEQVEERFHRLQSQHFELAHEVWRASLLDRGADLLAALELHYVELAAIFAVRPAENGQARIAVSLYRPAEFSGITGLAEWAGASFDGVIRAPVADGAALGPAFDELLRHELIHAFVREAGGRDVPGWLNEGLAQWLQPSGPSELARARAALRGRELIDLERLRGPLTGLTERAEVTAAYAQSLAFCGWIESEHGRAVLLAMVAGCRQEQDPAVSFEAWTRAPLREAFERFAVGL